MKAKAYLKLNLTSDVKSNKEEFLSTQAAKGVDLLLNEAGALVTQDMSRAKVPTAIFTSVFTNGLVDESGVFISG